MKSTKGFTLLELLAVIVVLAIIALIVTPFVTEAIQNAREGADKNAAYGIVNAAELFYATRLSDNGGEFATTVITFEASYEEPETTNKIAPTSGETQDSNGDPVYFEFKGKAPVGGSLTIDNEGNISFSTALKFTAEDEGWYYGGKAVDRNIDNS